MPYLFLALAVLAETIGTTALQASQQFTRSGPTIVTVLAYGAAFYLLGIALKYFPVGIAYAIWSGLGIVLIAVIGPSGLWPEARSSGGSGHGSDPCRHPCHPPVFQYVTALSRGGGSHAKGEEIGATY